jgi:chromosome partitioning protein
MATVVFCNRKGGVGKTLSTYYTGRWLARAGRNVDLVDIDPQQGLWDIAGLVGRQDGMFTKRLRLVRSMPARPQDSRQYVLIDTPPALDGSLPALNEADWLVIPVIPEAQEVAQLTKFLGMLDSTRTSRPFTRVLGILPVRFVRRSTVHQMMLHKIGELANLYGHRVLEPVAQSLAVTTYSMAGGLWRQVASELIRLEDQRVDRAA